MPPKKFVLQFDADNFIKDVFKTHNKFRKTHKAKPLHMNDELSAYATEWAELCAENLQIDHRKNKIYGENVWSGPLTNATTGKDPVAFWYQEVKHYNGDFSYETGRFTQIVWKKTTDIGIGVAYVPKTKRIYLVVNYNPPGNIMEQFEENIEVKKGK